MKFTRKKLNSTQPPKTNFSWLPKFFIVIFSLIICVMFFQILAKNIKPFFSNVAKSSLNIVSKVAGNEPEKDEYGQINFLLLGYGGGAHQGGYLTDSMMIASFDTKKGTVSFLSIPRDLYINTGKEKTKLNGLFPIAYASYNHGNSDFNANAFDEAAKDLQAKIKQITGISTQYYAFVSFDGFRKFIDSIGGIDVTLDKPFVDNQYPMRDDDSAGYITFSLPAGTSHLNGEAALKFARSRHSTSDFSRSTRQQQIIKTVIDKVKSQGLSNPTKIKGFYDQFQEVIKTNLGLQQILGLAKYTDNLNNFLSFGYNSDCNYSMRRIMQSGCFLYSPPVSQFGSAVLLPNENLQTNSIESYDDMKKFAFYVIDTPGFAIENTPITILDGINYKTYQGTSNPGAKLAYLLKNYGFNIVDLKVSKEKSDITSVYTNGNSVPETTNQLKQFISFDLQDSLSGNVDTGENYSGVIIKIGNDLELKNN